MVAGTDPNRGPSIPLEFARLLMQCKPATCRGALVPGAASQQIKETARGRPRGPGLLTATGEREPMWSGLQTAHYNVKLVIERAPIAANIARWLPGVDPNDPSVKDLLASLHNQGEQEKKEDK
uniref:Uncharacterized protein n=1 Tax=Zea mays TaxID=4577 RepID=A0A804UJD2_MAIZE